MFHWLVKCDISIIGPSAIVTCFSFFIICKSVLSPSASLFKPETRWSFLTPFLLLSTLYLTVLDFVFKAHMLVPGLFVLPFFCSPLKVAASYGLNFPGCGVSWLPAGCGQWKALWGEWQWETVPLVLGTIPRNRLIPFLASAPSGLVHCGSCFHPMTQPWILLIWPPPADPPAPGW